MSLHRFPSNHLFYQEHSQRYMQYLLDMNSIIDAICRAAPGIKQRTIESLLSKLKINGAPSTDRNQYLQYACELTVTGYLCRVLEAHAFDYEYPGNNGKDVDSSIEINGVRFNIEVKCPNPKRKAGQHFDSSLNLRTHGRIDDFVNLKQDINCLARTLNFDAFTITPNSDHNIKEALIDAANKFPRPVTDNQLNCVVLCGDDGVSLQHYYHCLFGAQGLFTDKSFHDNPRDYAEVDAVILTNLRHRHDRYLSSSKLSSPWLFESAFNLIVRNTSQPERSSNNLIALKGLIPNHNNSFCRYNVPGDAPPDVLDGIKLAYYVYDKVPQLDANCFDS